MSSTMPIEYNSATNEMFDVYDPMDTLYAHLDTIDAEQSGAPLILALRNFIQYLHTIPSFLAANPGFRGTVADACVQWANADQVQTNIGTSANDLLGFLGSLRNRDDYIST